MIERNAPLYVRSYDLARWLLERTQRFPKHQRFVLAQRLQQASLDLVECVTLALEHRRGRLEHLHAADGALTRLRLATRLAGDLELLRANQVEFAHAELNELGRMLGGWLRKQRVDAPSHS